MFEGLIPWNLAKGKIKENAIVYDKHNVPVGYLFQKEDKCSSCL